MQELSRSEEQKLVSLLATLEPGFLPYEIFKEIARLVPMSIIEFVPVRLSQDGNVEVLLLSRSKDDDIWPNMVHTPGTVIRATDTEGKLYLAFERILHDELLDTEVSSPHFVGSLLQKSRRGTEHAQIYWVEVVDEPKVGAFHAADNLPENLIESQHKFINQAAKSFIANKRKETILQ